MERITKGMCALLVLSFCTMALAARVRPGRDPADNWVIWADPFDNYSQWAYDNSEFWEGGPVPAGDPNGSYPAKSADTTGCGVSIQTSPGTHEMAREQWLSNDCPVITSPGNLPSDPGAFGIHYDVNCGGSGEVVTTKGMMAVGDYLWAKYGSRTSMPQFTRELTSRIQAIDEYRNPGDPAGYNAVKGTDENPLILVFYLREQNTAYCFDNSYVELSLGEDRAPTDYIWRGDPEKDYPLQECCPQGPYPIICQQVREVNGSVSENADDLTYLNANCPPLETKVWKSIAFGFLAILDKDPCGCEEQGVDAHIPTMNHFAVFDGNKWREIRNSRYGGLKDNLVGDLPQAGGVAITWPPSPGMKGQNIGKGDANLCNNFSVALGTNEVVIKIISDWILIYAETTFYNPNKTNPPWHAAIPRVYTGGFDSISWGVGAGCELDSASYTCKDGGTPYQCLTYSTNTGGYDRTYMDSMVLYDGELYFDDYVDPVRACCHQDTGTCDELAQSACNGDEDVWHPDAESCDDIVCCVDPFADADADDDVDMVDFGLWQACFSGDGNALIAGCECFNRQGSDNDVDALDFTDFEACFSGPTVPANPGCDD